jgi:transposase-like protein
MHKSRTEISKWLGAIFEICTAKNGVSALEVSIRIGVTYKCAWRMCHKIREAMGTDDDLVKLAGVFEIDETYVGGKLKNKQSEKNFNFHANKTIVFGIYQHGGLLRLRVVEKTSGDKLLPILTSSIKKGSTIYSDEHAPYKELPRLGFTHEFITHKKKEWSRGRVTTNRMEQCWMRFKNSIRGTYIHISRKHMESYLREFEFRHNHRRANNLERFIVVSRLMGFDLFDFFTPDI